MSVDSFRLFQLAQHGFCCSQMIIQLGMEELGIPENPDLIRAMQGLCGGIGRSGGTCGALTGGVCLISLRAGKGSATEEADPQLNTMIGELLQWFDEQYSSRNCADILNRTLEEGVYPFSCGTIVASTAQKALDILAQSNSEEEE